jgi:hypothetical protein
MGNVQVYERPPDEDRKKKKMTVYVVVGAFVLLVAAITLGLFLNEAPSFGKNDLEDKAEAGELISPEGSDVTSQE